MLLIKKADVYAPRHLGQKDVLVVGEKIAVVADQIPDSVTEQFAGMGEDIKVLNGEGKILIPGLIDSHVHITGGGGEGGFRTRTPELHVTEMVRAGITTVLGLLGTDGITRSVENLYAKTASLNEEGVSAYMLTGAYGYPSPTITGEADRDIIFIREVLGVKLAISDHRAPNVSVQELISLASKTRVAGMLGKKPGAITLHMGNDQAGLSPVFEALKRSSLPVGILRPTHVNRRAALVEEGYELLKMGGYVDYTCAMDGGRAYGECIAEAKRRGIPTEHITISSDGHGSWSRYGEDGTLLEIGVSGIDSLHKEIKNMVENLGMGLEEALPYVTTHVARALMIDEKKGSIKKSADADMVLLTKDLEIDSVIARGKVMMEEKELLYQGTYATCM